MNWGLFDVSSNVNLAIFLISLIVLVLLNLRAIRTRLWGRKKEANKAAVAKHDQIVSVDLDARPWPENPGAGRNVARQIMKAETVKEARSLFDDHLVAPIQRDSDLATTAILHRLHEEGSDDEFMDLALELNAAGHDISSPPKIEEEFGIRMRISR